jgi:hypothetical protein
LFNAELIGSALFNPNVSSSRCSPPTRGLITSVGNSATLLADTLSSSALAYARARCSPRSHASLAPKSTGCVCACTHYPVFKEPTHLRVERFGAQAPVRPGRPGFPRETRLRNPLGPQPRCVSAPSPTAFRGTF